MFRLCCGGGQRKATVSASSSTPPSAAAAAAASGAKPITTAAALGGASQSASAGGDDNGSKTAIRPEKQAATTAAVPSTPTSNLNPPQTSSAFPAQDQIWPLITAATQRALETGALCPIDTAVVPERLSDGGWSFVLRVASNLKSKDDDGNTVSRVQDFSTVSSEKLVQTIRSLKSRQGSGYGPPITSGSMAGYPTPSVNGRPLDPTLPSASNPVIPRESFVLNDAVLMAAQELGRRDLENRARGIPPTRKVLFIVSDGRELGSMNGYADVLKVLLTRQISVYAVAVESGIPGYGTAQRIRIPLPGFGVSNILPKYASATGGQYYSESSAHALEDAYTRVTEEARNQYTIGYRTRSTPSSTFRKVEVVVHRARLRVYARDGYYPLPPGR